MPPAPSCLSMRYLASRISPIMERSKRSCRHHSNRGIVRINSIPGDKWTGWSKTSPLSGDLYTVCPQHSYTPPLKRNQIKADKPVDTTRIFAQDALLANRDYGTIARRVPLGQPDGNRDTAWRLGPGGHGTLCGLYKT